MADYEAQDAGYDGELTNERLFRNEGIVLIRAQRVVAMNDGTVQRLREAIVRTDNAADHPTAGHRM